MTLSTFELATTEVTNSEYERFDPSHKTARGILGFSKLDNEAVIFVSWQNATNYAAWLTQQERDQVASAGDNPDTVVPYRLPTEAEWEYAARGNNATTKESYYWTGDTIPTSMQRMQNDLGLPNPDGSNAVSLQIAQFEPNGYGIYDTLGNVEEWCADWYGPYTNDSQSDPVGPQNGTFRVSRGGSHHTSLYYLRTANRMGALPHDQSWIIGFRVARDAPATYHAKTRHQRRSHEVSKSNSDSFSATATKSLLQNRAYEESSTPILAKNDINVATYVKIPGDGISHLPYKRHNHEPTVVACPNGDLLAVWFVKKKIEITVII